MDGFVLNEKKFVDKWMPENSILRIKEPRLAYSENMGFL